MDRGKPRAPFSQAYGEPEMKAARWSLERLIDFEAEIAKFPDVKQTASVSELTRGMDTRSAKQAGFSLWLDAVGKGGAGRGFLTALMRVASILALLSFAAGATAVTGLVDRTRGGIHVGLFLVILIGGQWLLIAAGLLFSSLRRSFGAGVSGVVSFVFSLARRYSGKPQPAWWSALVMEPGHARQALIWRGVSSLAITAAGFNLGLLAGLGGWVMFRHVGFFWETTTDFAMRDVLAAMIRVLSTPWSAWFPAAVPSEVMIDSARWTPGNSAANNSSAWWKFLLMAVLVWGLLPRVLIGLLAVWLEQRNLAELVFLSRRHRALWRALVEVARADEHEDPLDGVLVIDVGGAGVKEEDLRPFLLRRLRVNPVAWHSVAVLDANEETKTSEALAKAPAGVVLVSEAWALTAPRMTRLHQQVRSASGPDKPIRFVVLNLSSNGRLEEAAAEEKRVWENFVDSLADAETEVCFYQRTTPPL